MVGGRPSGLGWNWSRPPLGLRPFFQPVTPEWLAFTSKMLARRVIERTRFLRFQARLFSVPKKDMSERRVILDLSTLNLHMRCESFKMTMWS